MREDLRRLRALAGDPPKKALKRYAVLARHCVGESTLMAVVSPSAKGNPRWATVEAFIDGCIGYAAAHGKQLPEDFKDKSRWRTRYDAAYAAPARAAPAQLGEKFAAARAAYLARLRERFGHIDTETLLPLTELDEPTPVMLPKVFVPQMVRRPAAGGTAP